LATAALLLAMGLGLNDKRLAHGASATPWLLAGGLALITWFGSAPLARYGSFAFWSLAAFAVARTARAPGRSARWLPAAAILAAVLLNVWYEAKATHRGERLGALAGLFWTPPGRDAGFHPLRQIETGAITLTDGSPVFRPVRVAYEAPPPPWQLTLPWDAPLPATNNVYLNLERRDTEHLKSGFRIRPLDFDWPEVYRQEVARVRNLSGWGVGRLAVHFTVRPSLIRRALSTAGLVEETDPATAGLQPASD
jgi:hypothetical protein